MQFIIPGCAGDLGALFLKSAAKRFYRLGKSVLRFTATGEGTSFENLPEALKDTLPHLQGDKAVAVVCAGQTCLPPTNDPVQLTALLENGARGAAGMS